uniref:Uncharacterized protein n=1 Tax=Glossina brevipalpis TaxID=37001 RepID=A0A1A9WD62_9MUSC
MKRMHAREEKFYNKLGALVPWVCLLGEFSKQNKELTIIVKAKQVNRSSIELNPLKTFDKQTMSPSALYHDLLFGVLAVLAAAAAAAVAAVVQRPHENLLPSMMAAGCGGGGGISKGAFVRSTPTPRAPMVTPSSSLPILAQLPPPASRRLLEWLESLFIINRLECVSKVLKST